MGQRQEAQLLGGKTYFTGKPCKWGHVSARYTGSHSCVACKADQLKKYRLRHPSLTNKSHASWVAANAAKDRESRRVWRAKNADRLKQYNKEYLALNRHRFAAHNRARQARKLRATPPWADLVMTAAVYRQCEWISAASGIKHHVDHFYPLKSDWVCGLHVDDNLRIIPATENLKKRNRRIGE